MFTRVVFYNIHVWERELWRVFGNIYTLRCFSWIFIIKLMLRYEGLSGNVHNYGFKQTLRVELFNHLNLPLFFQDTVSHCISKYYLKTMNIHELHLKYNVCSKDWLHLLQFSCTDRNGEERFAITFLLTFAPTDHLKFPISWLTWRLALG